MQVSLFEQIPCQLINGTEPMKLNIGCGNNKIEGYLNLDAWEDVEPDLVLDIRKGTPFPDNCAQEILFFHSIEHIEEKYHARIFDEFWRLLVPGGLLLISYPEFERCAMNYIENYKGMREFWKNTLYGLQRYAGDYHVSLMNSEDLAIRLQESGFINIEWQAEKPETFNTIMKAEKGPPFGTYEELLKNELFNPKIIN